MEKSKASRGIKNTNKTFVIEIKDNQNYTWQGNVTWVEEKRKESFRSALELITMIDSTMEEDE